MAEPSMVETAPIDGVSLPLRTLRHQLWLGIAAIALMTCGVALALSALTVEGALHEHYNNALALARKTLETQQAAIDLRRMQARFAQHVVNDGAGAQSTRQAFDAVMQRQAALVRLTTQLHGFDAAAALPASTARIDTALATLAQVNVKMHDDLIAQRGEPSKARDALLGAADHALAEIEAALPELVDASREQTDRMSQHAREYGQLARRSLLVLGVIALLLSVLLGYVGWRAVRSNACLLDRLHQIAHEDALTGAVNRRGLDERLPVELARAGRIAYPLTVVMIDLDHFKRFNDRRGHPAGDKLLRGAVLAWRAHLRPMDMLARYGGEEFTLVLPACDAEQAGALVSRLRTLVPERQTFSAGVAKWNGTDSADELLRCADHALLQAKKAGRNRTIVWGSEPQITLPLVAR